MEFFGTILGICILLLPIVTPIYFGRMFFDILRIYRLAKREGEQKLGGMLFNLICSGVVFFVTAAFLIYILVCIILMFTGVMRFM